MALKTKTSQAAGAIIEKNGKILLVKEAEKAIKGQWSHPSGCLKIGENPVDAIKREVKEETGFDFDPSNILGIYSLLKTEEGFINHVIKVIFLGDISGEQGEYFKDEIAETKWFTPEEIENMDKKTLRNIDIKKMVKDYFAGKKYPLDIITHTVSE